MTLPVIDDAMVKRFKNAVGWCGTHRGDDERIQKALEAALNPPAEPPIPVSEKMKAAAYDYINGMASHDVLKPEEIYRAMRRVELEEQKK